jgi:hypothetical protein
MSKPEQIWPGPRLTAYFKAILDGEPDLDPEVRDRLIQKCSAPINRMLVYWNPADQAVRAEISSKPDPVTSGRARGGAPAQEVKKGKKSQPGEAHSGPSLEDMAPWPEPGLDGEAETSTAARPPKAEQEVFDPYSFSVVALFKRGGREALLGQLSAITSVDHLRTLADAQHLSIPKDLDEPAALRLAIVEGTEQRIADRRAAGS